ncbi:single-stranded DNA-binding protein [Bacillus mycoides]|uniref:Single-stranded DNA-binding protein n=1 Tax=Bacillus mycoides TaxID=1405 RepID=A0ABC9QUB4_BACMY|nr:single-stranded DNA-binding protein [Bacillus mycoides]
MNRTILVGRLTKDPDLRYTPNGVAVATFTLAVNRPFMNQGQRESDFISVVIWRKQAENVANYLRKGSLAGVDGRIQTRNYEGQDGKRVYVTEVLAESVQFLEPKNKNNRTEQRETPSNSGYVHVGANNTGSTKNDDPFSNVGQSIDISDDDLPF